MTQNLLKLPKESTKPEKKIKKLPQKVTQKVKMHQREYHKTGLKDKKIVYKLTYK
jgi:hypothetical protein